MPETDATTTHELRMLQARAYGPAADIHGDPTALRRLRELEEQARARSEQNAVDAAPAPPTTLPPATDAAEPATSTPDAAPVDPEAVPTGPAEPDPAAPALSTRIKVLWGASVLVAAGVAAVFAFSAAFIAPMTATPDAHQIAALSPTSTVEVPEGFMARESDGPIYEFSGYTLLGMTGVTFGADSGDCFVMVPTADIPETYDDQSGWSTEGRIFSGCSAGDFPAIIQFVVDDYAPEQMRAEFAEGTALRFVFDGDLVGVFESD